MWVEILKNQNVFHIHCTPCFCLKQIIIHNLFNLFQCSFYPPCQTSPYMLEEAVELYEKHYAVIGLPFNCWFSPQNSHQAIRTKRFRLYHVVNGMLWTIIILFMSFVALLYTIKRRGCDILEGVAVVVCCIRVRRWIN